MQVAAFQAIERFSFEKSKARGGGTVRSGKERGRKNCVFFVKRQAAWFEPRSVSNENAPEAGHAVMAVQLFCCINENLPLGGRFIYRIAGAVSEGTTTNRSGVS